MQRGTLGGIYQTELTRKPLITIISKFSAHRRRICSQTSYIITSTTSPDIQTRETDRRLYLRRSPTAIHCPQSLGSVVVFSKNEERAAATGRRHDQDASKCTFSLKCISSLFEVEKVTARLLLRRRTFPGYGRARLPSSSIVVSFRRPAMFSERARRSCPRSSQHRPFSALLHFTCACARRRCNHASATHSSHLLSGTCRSPLG